MLKYHSSNLLTKKSICKILETFVFILHGGGNYSSSVNVFLKTIVALIGDFTRDVCEENESDAELLHELQNKVRPFMITLDEEMSACERLIRINVDSARISEDRVGWLLNFNKYQLEMRRVLGELSGAVYDDLERVLTLRHRGCLGIRPKKDTLDNLHQMKLGMDRAEKLIARERVGYSNT
uniref:Rx_N domain-containing protein n=1 Tax=Ascaris lumbricoides TaxID=6252 RepID=A0A0M3I6Z4_ASCLU